MTPEEEMFEANMKLLLAIQFEGMDKEARNDLLASMGDIKGEYEAAVQKSKDEKLTEDERKYYKDVGTAIAKSLPEVVKGALAASRAFQKGDYMTGSAAIMDICASVIPVLTAVFAATGPEGMLVGALFSVIGQILSFFAPKQPSLAEEIKKMLENLAAASEIVDMRAVGMSISHYTASLNNARKEFPGILKLPLQTEKDADSFRSRLEALNIGLAENQKKLAVPEFASWKVAAWLEMAENQDNERWPEVLGQWCRAYADLVNANVVLNCVVNPKEIAARLAETEEGNKASPLPPLTRFAVHGLLIDLEAIVRAARVDWAEWSKEAARVLKQIQTVAQDHGLFLCIGTDKYLYGATGRKGISGAWTYLVLGNGARAHRISLTVPQEDVNLQTPQYRIPQYDLFLCEHWIAGGGEVLHARIDPQAVRLSDAAVISGEALSDVWALPAPKDQTPRDPKALFIYAAQDGGNSGVVKLYSLGPDNILTYGNWSPGTKAGLVNYRAVTHPPTTLAGDPDGDAMSADLLKGTNHYSSIHYGALRSSPDIYVVEWGKYGYVPSPWASYTGIDVDDYYLWVFGPAGIACATHASVVKCADGKSPSPRWMTYSIPDELLFDGYPSPNIGGEPYTWERSRELQRSHADKLDPLQGLISLSVCKDGTLVASIVKRIVRYPALDTFEATDSLVPFHTSMFHIDVKAGTINVEPWRQIGGAGLQVVKMPIPCWSLLQSVKADLQANG